MVGEIEIRALQQEEAIKNKALAAQQENEYLQIDQVAKLKERQFHQRQARLLKKENDVMKRKSKDIPCGNILEIDVNKVKHGYNPVDTTRISAKNSGYAYVNPKIKKHLSLKPPLPARPPQRRVKLDPYSKGVMSVCKDYGTTTLHTYTRIYIHTYIYTYTHAIVNRYNFKYVCINMALVIHPFIYRSIYEYF